MPAHSGVKRRTRFFFLLGVGFELVLVLLGFVLPESPLAVEVRNFATVTHYPLMRVMEGLGLGESDLTAIIALPVGLTLMASIWGFLFFLVVRLFRQALARFNLGRREKTIVRCGLGFVFLMVLAWVIIASRAETPIPFTAPPGVKAVVDGNSTFALDLYQKLKKRPGNLFFSPYSISTVMAMTCAGARGTTANEMARVLHFDTAQTNPAAAFGALDVRMNQIQRWNRITLTTAHSLWGQQGHPFMDDYLNLVRANFRAEVRQVDFEHSAAAASGQINKWAEEKSSGKIKDVAAPGLFKSDTALVLCDAIYFKGKWLHQFKTADTRPADFVVSSNQIVTAQMMVQKSDFRTARSEDNTVGLLELPYSGRDLSMVILLPTRDPWRESPGVEQNGVADLERDLTSKNLEGWLAKLDRNDPHETWVDLPRFTTTQSFNLKDELKSLGMTSAFNDGANFSGIDGTQLLYVSHVVHETFVEVDEAGTEAAALTLMEAKSKGITDRFIVDHPFIFLIRDNGSGSILFLGRIIDPTK